MEKWFFGSPKISFLYSLPWNLMLDNDQGYLYYLQYCVHYEIIVNLYILLLHSAVGL